MLSINIKLVTTVIKDRKSHELYDLHQSFRLTPKETLCAVNFLASIGIIRIDGNTFFAKNKVEPKAMSLLYKSIQGRFLNLDEKDITSFRLKSLKKEELYTPNFNELDEYLIDSTCK
jgi:hypothetical protein